MDQTWCHDGIEIVKLSLDHLHCIGTDAWGRQKQQPVLVSAQFGFRSGFDSAAATDSLDLNTVNYGQVSKHIRSIKSAAPWESLDDFARRIYQIVLECLPGPRTVESCRIQIHLPKASMLGSEVILSHYHQHLLGVAWPKLERSLCISQVRMPVLVGINDNERKQKQPLLFSIWLHTIPVAATDTYSEIEGKLYEMVEPTCFETLESLALFVIHRLNSTFLATAAPHSTIRLRIEKPLAVPFASCPAIEVVRTPIELAKAAAANRPQGDGLQLTLVKPYV